MTYSERVQPVRGAVFEAAYAWPGLLRLSLFAAIGIAFGFWMISLQSAEVAGTVPRRLVRLSRLFDATPLETLHGFGMVFLFAFAAMLVLIGSYWVRQEPAVRVDETGVFYHRWSMKAVPFGNIARVEIVKFGLTKSVQLFLVDRWASPPDTLYGWFQQLSPIRAFGDIPIDMQAMDRTTEELLGALAQFGRGKG